MSYVREATGAEPALDVAPSSELAAPSEVAESGLGREVPAESGVVGAPGAREKSG